MKKSILIIILLLTASVSFGQLKKDTVKKAPVPAKIKPEFKADVHRKYAIILESDEIGRLMQTSNAGVVPYLETTNLPMNQLESAKEYFKGIYVKINTQLSVQAAEDTAKFKADTTAANKAKPKK